MPKPLKLVLAAAVPLGLVAALMPNRRYRLFRTVHGKVRPQIQAFASTIRKSLSQMKVAQ